MIRSFFKLPKSKKFDFEPRYYDPVKEDIEGRIAAIEQEEGIYVNDEGKPVTNGLRSKLQHGGFSQGMKNEQRSSSIRLLIIIAILGGIAYLFFTL